MDVIALLKLLVEQVNSSPDQMLNVTSVVLHFQVLWLWEGTRREFQDIQDIQKADGGKVWALPFQLTADVGLPGSLAPAHHQSHLGGGSVKNAETCHLSFDQTNQN